VALEQHGCLQEIDPFVVIRRMVGKDEGRDGEDDQAGEEDDDRSGDPFAGLARERLAVEGPVGEAPDETSGSAPE
jgi:hypothetical protein